MYVLKQLDALQRTVMITYEMVTLDYKTNVSFCDLGSVAVTFTRKVVF